MHDVLIGLAFIAMVVAPAASALRVMGAERRTRARLAMVSAGPRRVPSSDVVFLGRKHY